MRILGFIRELVLALVGADSADAPRRGQPIAGGGYASSMPIMRPYRGTTRQVCGLFPFIVGSGAPLVGVPVGRATNGSGTICADPISWFERGLISAPSAMVLGLNGLGKSSLVRRMIEGLEAFGVHTMVLGDIKPDYVDLMKALGAQVIEIGHGKGGINPLDAGNSREAASLLRDAGATEEADALEAEAHERKKTLVASLVHIIRRSAPSDREETILDEAIRVLEERGGQPVLADVLNVVREGPAPLRRAALDRGDDAHYREVTEALEASLMALLSGRFGAIFAVETTTPMMMDRSVVFDVHFLLQADEDLQAAVLLACWSYGFATVETAQMLADVGVAPRRRYQIVMDELWRTLRSSSGLVDRVDALTRLNRSVGVGQMMITHSMSDFAALESESDRLKALGFVERSKMLFLGGLPAREMDLLSGVVAVSEAEQELLASWNAPGTYDPSTGREAAPVGRGKFLLKTSGAPGSPLRLDFVKSEVARGLSNTNQRWEMR
ncbi:MAG: ATP/GTP-binding protein [Schaalia hyovaginalis]|uniref:ATP/GTP-binding protein n=1 Tax=Schaalia hyovaginalis TaxID=29316 RepID=UPI002A90C68D|nr:ATP/GTP-binding protein [Schaalia hyovaginalis]MDY6213649.1 ATP/GTP-binding protein [Schaalia hyovaginalis]